MPNFSLKSKKYDSVSFPQMELSQELFELSLDFLPNVPPALLDVGCGTGNLSLDLASLRPKVLDCLDISPEMLEVCREKLQESFPNTKWRLFVGDAEFFNSEVKYNAVYSSAAIQWLNDIPKFLARAKSWISPNGILAVGCFGEKTLGELRTAYFEATGRVLENKAKFFSEKKFGTLFEKAGFKILDSATCIYSQGFADPVTALKSIGNMGVTTASEKPITRAELQKLKDCLLKTGNGENSVNFSWELFAFILG
ncbi:malonyl-[acyl-carrier protein] O-methyltransferase [Fibrobacterales bacterium]|nr:malonyl-[acyl-carrier protein] O-methyltransferase [Fibrobacterales bacterium]